MAEKRKILIVEDDADTSDMLCEYFNLRGYEVLTAAWGGDALELCRFFSQKQESQGRPTPALIKKEEKKRLIDGMVSSDLTLKEKFCPRRC